jgi:hypothetical protein
MKIKELLETGTGGGGGAITTADNVATGPIYPNKKGEIEESSVEEPSESVESEDEEEHE